VSQQQQTVNQSQGGVAEEQGRVVLAIEPQVPVLNQPAHVVPNQGQQGPGHICAQGTASRPMSGSPNPLRVYALIFAGQLGPGSAGVPLTPPPGTLSVVPAGQNYFFPNIPGAICTLNAPLPWNTLVLWAEFNDPGNQFDRSFVPFLGQSANATDCGT
jgi:hypothetical protein